MLCAPRMSSGAGAATRAGGDPTGVAGGDVGLDVFAAQHPSLARERDDAAVRGAGRREQTVVHREAVVVDADLEALVEVRDLLELRRRRVIGEEDAVAAELGVVRG